MADAPPVSWHETRRSQGRTMPTPGHSLQGRVLHVRNQPLSIGEGAQKGVESAAYRLQSLADEWPMLERCQGY